MMLLLFFWPFVVLNVLHVWLLLYQKNGGAEIDGSDGLRSLRRGGGAGRIELDIIVVACEMSSPVVVVDVLVVVVVVVVEELLLLLLLLLLFVLLLLLLRGTVDFLCYI